MASDRVVNDAICCFEHPLTLEITPSIKKTIASSQRGVLQGFDLLHQKFRGVEEVRSPPVSQAESLQDVQDLPV